MDKAIKILTDNLHKAEQYLAIAPMDSDMLRGWAEIIKEHSEALAELQDKDKHITELEAKLDGLRGYCRKQIEHFNSKDSRIDYDWGLRDRTITILDKLDEGKEQ